MSWYEIDYLSIVNICKSTMHVFLLCLYRYIDLFSVEDIKAKFEMKVKYFFSLWNLSFFIGCNFNFTWKEEKPNSDMNKGIINCLVEENIFQIYTKLIFRKCPDNLWICRQISAHFFLAEHVVMCDVQSSRSQFLCMCY